MFITKMSLSRRTFLRGVGATVGAQARGYQREIVQQSTAVAIRIAI
jgi:hypothetical protein